MPTSTEIAIATTTLSSPASSITFSSIPGTYTDLKLVLVASTTYATTGYDVDIRFNSDSGTNYSFTYLAGTGTATDTFRLNNRTSIQTQIPGTTYSGIYSLCELNIQSYASSDYKTVLESESRDFNGAGTVTRRVNLWRSTSAITSISLGLPGADFATGTTATLYGIL